MRKGTVLFGLALALTAFGPDCYSGQIFKDGSGSGIGLPTGVTFGAWGDAQGGWGIVGTSQSSDAVHGGSGTGYGVVGTSFGAPSGQQRAGVLGISSQAGVIELNPKSAGIGVHGMNTQSLGIGVMGEGGEGGYGVYGKTASGIAVLADSEGGSGVVASSGTGQGVQATTRATTPGIPAVFAHSDQTYGVLAEGGDIGLFARNLTGKKFNAYLGTRTLAGDFYGDVHISGSLKKGGGGFRIDHPIDPAHLYLSHSFVESPDMKNIYDGVIVLDKKGEGIVKLPAWFESLNYEFRYQLTAIGHAAPNLYVKQEVHDNMFKVAGGVPNMKVSWMVTGIRKDLWANANRIRVEEEKPAMEAGHYLYPELYAASDDKSIEKSRYRSVATKQTPSVLHQTTRAAQ